MKKMMVMLVVAAALLLPCAGCKTSPVKLATQSEVVVVQTVDSAMQAWKDYVEMGLASQREVDLVKVNYQRYYNAQLVAKAALSVWVENKDATAEVAWQNAQASVTEAKNALLDSVTSLMKGKR